MDYYARRMGRRKTTDRTGRALLIRLSDAERAQLDAAAERVHMRTASWLRDLGLNAAQLGTSIGKLAKKSGAKKSGAKKGGQHGHAR